MLLQLSQWLAFDIFGLDAASRFGEAARFFFYDTVKIFLLLLFAIFVIGVIRSFIPEQALKRAFSQKGFFAHLAASMFGALTPFCSCSSIPIFISFLRAGAPLGVLLSFLLTSPIINEYLLVLMIGFFGWKIAVAYLISGVVIGVLTGMVIDRIGLDHLVEDDIVGVRATDAELMPPFDSFLDRVKFGWSESTTIIKKIWIWILVGVALGAVAHNYVPGEMVQAAISSTGIFSVPLAVILGVPMYGSCAAIVPIALVLFQKGVPLGTALAFMMATSALSLPEAVMLRRVMKLPLIGIFFGMATLVIIATGYLFNFLTTFLI